MEYELLFFTSVANEDRVDTIKKDITEILTSLGGDSIGDFNDIGKRKLAYPIRRNTHAFFSFVRFNLEERQNIPEIGKRLGLYDKIMRHIIVRADEIGKAVGAIDIRPAEIAPPREEKPKKEEPLRPEQRAEPAKPKATMEELDEKLSEILEETPS